MNKLLLLGGNGDIGQAIKNKFVSEGFHVNSPSSKELNLENIDLIEGFMSQHDGFDVLIQCAGFNEPKAVDDVSIDDIFKTFKINVFGFYKIVQMNLDYFKKKNNGWILGISSLYGTISRENRSPYAMSKHALNGLIKTLAIELGKYNIKSNTLSPGFVETKMTRKNNSEDKIKSFENKIPLGRLASPENIADAALFLCSGQNGYINGQDIIIDGGFMAGGFQQ